MKKNIFVGILLIAIALIAGFFGGYGLGFSMAPRTVVTENEPYPSINETIDIWANYHQGWLEEEGFIVENRTLEDSVYGFFVNFQDFIAIGKAYQITNVYRYEEINQQIGLKRVSFWYLYAGSSGTLVPYVFRVW